MLLYDKNDIKNKFITEGRRATFDLIDEYESDIEEYNNHIIHLTKIIDNYKKTEDARQLEVNRLQAELDNVLLSKRYSLRRILWKVVDKLQHSFNPLGHKLVRVINLPRDTLYEILYMYQLSKIKKGKSKAIILHLYYIDTWEYFVSKLDKLMNTGEFDLVVSVPIGKYKKIHKVIESKYENSIVIRTPNKGRDVLPFLYIVRRLKKSGYIYVLKIHSKKSPQRRDGSDWADKMISDLTVDNESKLREIEETMAREDTAIIGPAGSYVPLTTYYNDNQQKVFWLSKITLGRLAAEHINEHNDQYGFYAGTMFWLRIDAVSKLLDQSIWVNNFANEHGQLDGTIAHAIERYICVLPEYNKMKLYEIDNKGVRPTLYKTSFIPEWSDYYHAK